MKRKIVICLLLILMTFSIIGCDKNSDLDNKKPNNNINDNSKVKIIAESYEKYTELKAQAYEKLNKKIEETDNMNISFSMGLLGFSTLDLTLIPVAFCGLENETAISGLSFLYSNINYQNDKDSCKITFVTEDETMTYDTKYDEKTDSVQTKIYANDILTAISEYTKLDNGYASQFYSSSDDQVSVYRAIFDKNKIIVSMQSNISEPESIFKNKGIVSEEWTKNQELWAKYEDGNFMSIYDGKEY